MILIEAVRALAANPVLLLLLVTGPVAILGIAFKIFPSGWLLFVCSWSCVASVLILINSQLYVLVLTIDLAIGILAAYDAFWVAKRRDFEVDRDCQRVASLKKHHAVSMMITNRSARGHQVLVRDGIPQEFHGDPEEFEIRLDAKSRVSLHYDFKATRRGAFEIDAIHIRAQSRFGLWYRYLKCPCNTVIHVYPDMKQMSEYALLARTNRLSLLGVRRTRRIGQDNDFERLRDYSLDDNYKHIDWRSTARRHKLTVKDFQTSQSQRVIFLLDCGRMMTNVASEISLLDHSLNAMLMLSYVALERGDSVGLITFSDQVHSFVPARGGRSQMNQLLHASFDRFPEMVESRYNEAFLYLNSRCRKRSLVVLVTNVIDDVNSQQIQQHLARITGRHLPVGVFLRDHQMFDAVEAHATSGPSYFRSGAAAEILCWRREVITDLQQKGVLSLDVFPENMTAPLINKYLEIKARNLL